jgi:polyferredoxin
MERSTFSQETKMKGKPTALILFRDLVRLLFVFSFFFLPELTERVLGVELENEYIVLFAILLFGTYWCGWFCPFGHAQYLAEIAGRKCFPNLQVAIPVRADKYLRLLKYAFLTMFVYIFAVGEHGYFDNHYEMYQSTWYSRAYLMFKMPWAIMIIPLFIPRFFCKYLCYQKAAYQIINRVFPFLFIRRNRSACVSCEKCAKVCPMGIDIANSPRISGGECIGCFNCVDESGCPTKPSSLRLTWLGREVNPLRFAITAFLVYLTATLVMILGFGSIH